METCKIKVKNMSKYPLPKYQTEGSSGMDLYANISNPLVIKPLERKLIPTGIYISMPNGYEAQIRARSGLSFKYGITIANGIGTIDSDYRGEIKIILINFGEKNYILHPGERIAQMVISKYVRIYWEKVDELDNTQRGQGGLGHSGI
ncbi:dUTP diphosphatase [Garciella nitratireducens]|uniref:dUTP diphosphatase n=1 Tax=Garciella nitratireducens TaxID=218205 RepID=UPI001BD5FB9A|nr:dUTP diphosphatase [Garciella nitratireducens]